jgi:hypothetical protein
MTDLPLQQWFEEATNVTRLFTNALTGDDYIIYLGFKITRTEDSEYTIEDVRRSDLYNPLRKTDARVLLKRGFAKGVEFIRYQKDLKRVGKSEAALLKAYNGKKEALAQLDNPDRKKTLAFYEKKVKNCSNNIQHNADMNFFYRSRVEQYELKNNIE